MGLVAWPGARETLAEGVAANRTLAYLPDRAQLPMISSNRRGVCSRPNDPVVPVPIARLSPGSVLRDLQRPGGTIGLKAGSGLR